MSRRFLAALAITCCCTLVNSGLSQASVLQEGNPAASATVRQVMVMTAVPAQGTTSGDQTTPPSTTPVKAATAPRMPPSLPTAKKPSPTTGETL